MQLIDKQTKMLFPTPMFSGKVSDLGVCDRVEKKLREMQKSGQGLKHNFEDFAFLTADDIFSRLLERPCDGTIASIVRLCT
jgi:hypothetical protein